MSKKSGRNHSHHHAPPLTRRDFLARGLIDVSTFAVMPSILGMILNQHRAYADDCPSSSAASGLLPFLVFDMAGGGALPGNFVVRDQGGNLLPSYSDLGLGTAPSTYTAFGAPMAGSGTTNVSQILAGILAKTTPAAQAALRMGVIAHQSQSDTSSNQHSALMHVAKSGLQGALVRSGLGTSGSRSGANSDVPIFDSTLKPLQIRGYTDFANALSYGPVLSSLPQSQLKALAKATLNLSAEQGQKLAGMNLGKQFATLVRCGLTKNMDYTSPSPGIDPRQDPVFQKNYSLTTGSGTTTRDTQIATIVMNVLKGNSGPGAIEIGGCDYHDGTQTTGDAKDLETGQEIGRALQAAFDLGKPLVFQLLTDGGIFSDPGARTWRGDDNNHGLTVVGVMNPAGAPTMKRTQIGAYTTGQVADTTTVIGSDPKTVAYAVFANYLQLSGRMDLFQQLVAPNLFPQTAIDQVLLFG